MANPFSALQLIKTSHSSPFVGRHDQKDENSAKVTHQTSRKISLQWHFAKIKVSLI